MEQPDVTGNLDLIDADGAVEGWAVAKSTGASSIDVALVVDGNVLATVRADRTRDDVNAALMTTGAHGFHVVLPDSLRDGLEHVLRVYGVGANGNEELGGSPTRFTRVLPCITAGPKVDPTDSEFVVTLKANTGKFISAECGGDDVGQLSADRDTAGEWEQLYVSLAADGHVSLRTSHGRLISAEGGGGHELHANRTALGPWESFKLQGTLTDGATISLQANDDRHYVSSATPMNAEATSIGATEQFTLSVLTSPVKQRKGLVHAEGRSWVDDGGPFYPLGQTLFWALSGWKTDRARLKQNLEYLSRHHYDYVRILGEVDWPGREIDPNWPDYQQVLGEFIDEAYDVYGLRTELTLVGGVGDPLSIAQEVAPVINAGRQHKIMNLEIANESYQRPCTLEQLYSAGRYLRQNTPNLVAISSGEGTPATSGDWRADYVRLYLPADAANLGTIHMDRTYGDGGWRIARQPWDWKDLPFPVSHNEPIGPRSSVREETDPLRLAMLRAVGLINGVEAFVLHNAAGVTGAVDPARNRPANLWEVPGIDGVMDAVRGLDAFLPARVGDGQHWNNAWSGNPWVADPIWQDGAPEGVNRNYTVATADGWVSTESGIKDRVTFTSSRHALVEVFDPLLGKQREVELQAGQTLTLNPVSRDSGGLGAFIIVGHYR